MSDHLNFYEVALRKAASMLIGISLALLAFFCVGVTISNIIIKEEVAQTLGNQVRRFALIGDYREMEMACMPMVHDVFKHISYVDSSGVAVFSLPANGAGSVSSESSLAWLSDGSFTINYSLGGDKADSGHLVFSYDRFANLRLALELWCGWLVMAIPVAIMVRRRLVKGLLQTLDHRKNEAIARMTGMLAHDVRKPFSILRMGLRILGSAKDPVEVKKVLSRLIPEIDKAVSSVDGLIADVMEIGSTSNQLIQEPASPEALIEATLGEIFQIYPKVDIAISYDFQHSHRVNVHVQKVGRVFSNIVGNALQAIGPTGAIWFKTRQREGLIEFRLGNAGSVIPPESLPKLFDAFFTSGKKGGTGLGLAIAEKIITSHGGRIWCESGNKLEYPDGYVEFRFTLPVAENQVSDYKGRLPSHSYDITKAVLAVTESTVTPSNIQSAEEVKLEAAVAAASKKLGRPLKILIVDDESIYRAGLIGMLTHSSDLAAAVAISEAASSDDAIHRTVSEAYDLVMTDVDLGNASPIDGFELVNALRIDSRAKQRPDAVICVLSNRIVSSDHKTAIAKGADAFISKPISNVALLKLLLQTFQSIEAPHEQSSAANKIDNKPLPKPSVAVLDDNIFILEAWTDALGADSQVFGFASPEDLMEKLRNDPVFLNSLACVVTDFHFDNSTVYDGIDVGKLVKSRRPGLAVLLSSDGEVKDLDLAGSIDHVIAKTPASFGTLTQRYSL